MSLYAYLPDLPAKKLSKVEKKKLKRTRQKAAKLEEEKRKKKNTKNKNKKKKKEDEESDDESESDMDTSEEAKEGEKKVPQDFQTPGPAVQGTDVGPVSNPPQPQGTPTASNTNTESLGSLTNFPDMLAKINRSMLSMAQMAGIQNLSLIPQVQAPAAQPPPPPSHNMSAVPPPPLNQPNFTHSFQQEAASLAAMRAQQFSQFQHREMLSRELNRVQNQIHLTQVQAPGCGSLVELAQAEANLKHKMMMAGMMPPQ